MSKHPDAESEYRYDVVIIGAGTAGQTAYQNAVKTTDRVLVINAGEWNTTCARVGCMPSKLLATAGKIAHKSKTAELFGIVNQTNIDGKKVMQRVQHQRDAFTASAQQVVDAWPEAHKLEGFAHFIDQHTLSVSDQVNDSLNAQSNPQTTHKIIKTKTTIIATGSTPIVPEGWRDILGDKLLTSDDIFELKDLPKSMAVVGTGAIGLELAQAFARLGVKVYLFGRQSTVGGLTHPELRQQATDLMAQEMTMLLSSSISRVAVVDDQVNIYYQNNDQPQYISVDYLLCATGRSANITALQLNNIDAKYGQFKPDMINTNSHQLDDLPIFIAGDAGTLRAIQHEAANAGRIAAKNALNYPQVKAFAQYAPLAIVFIDPQMAIAGLSHAALLKAHIEFKSASVSFARQGRATVLAENYGALYLFACSKTFEVLGAEILGPDAEHLAHLLAWSIQQKLSVNDLLAMPFYHPVIEEALRTALSRVRQEILPPSA
jgi:dihydrolipoamide dehydrogenase